MTLVEVYNSSNVQLIEIITEGASLFGALANLKKNIRLHCIAWNVVKIILWKHSVEHKVIKSRIPLKKEF